MTREIKFRAWDSAARDMIYSGSYIDYYTSLDGRKDGVEDDASQEVTRSFIDHPWEGYKGHIIEICYEHDFRDTTSRIFKGNLMQYTGLKDKNGKEVFEGDIVKVSGLFIGEYDKSICEVYYDYKNGRWWLRDSRREDYDNDCGAFSCTCIGRIDWSSVEIIGNMYENYFVEE